MATVFLNSLAALAHRVPRDMKAREKRIAKAISKTATKGAALVRRRVPVAFSELRDSIDHDAHRIFADAPHAAAVENGSRPHMPQIEPLIAWVKLRGTQGLSGRSLKRMSGTTTAGHVVRVKSELAEMAKARGGYNSVDDPEQIAWRIALAIKKHGTKPHHYMGSSVAPVVEILDEQVRAALEDPASRFYNF